MLKPSFFGRLRLRSRFRLRLPAILGIDLRTLALFRVAVVAVVIIDLAIRSTSLAAHYSDWGVLPRAALLDKFTESPWCLSLHLISGTVAVQAILMLLAASCALLLMIGYRTQIMSIVSWFLLISLHNRNPMILHGGDFALRMLLFWGMFLPLGARFSVDRVLRVCIQSIDFIDFGLCHNSIQRT